MSKKKKPKLTRLKVETKKLETIAYRKWDIKWFWRWLKLAVDMEGETIEVGAKKVLVQQTNKKGEGFSWWSSYTWRSYEISSTR